MHNLFRVDENGIEQYCAANCPCVEPGSSPQLGVTMLNNIVTTLNNVGSETLFNAVFNSPEQVVRFCWII